MADDDIVITVTCKGEELAYYRTRRIDHEPEVREIPCPDPVDCNYTHRELTGKVTLTFMRTGSVQRG